MTNQATGFQSNFVSDETGAYNFRNLTPGKYRLEVAAAGFKSTAQGGVELAVNQAARVEVHLEVGKTDETVTVTADTSLLNYDNQPLWRWEYGTPFSFYSSNCNQVPQFRQGCVPGLRPGAQIQAHGRNGFNPSEGTYFNINAFETDFSQFGYTGTGKAVTTVYGPYYQNLDISFTKDTTITERVHFKLSASFFNSLNNHYLINSQGGNYGGPSVAFTTDVSSCDFGKWNGAVTTPRTIQFAGRIEF